MNHKRMPGIALATFLLGACTDATLNPPPRVATTPQPAGEHTRTTDVTRLAGKSLDQAQPTGTPGMRTQAAKASPGAPPRTALATQPLRAARYPGVLPGIIRAASTAPDRENYGHFEDNPLRVAREEPLSTFSIDVDSGSYSNVRRMLNQGRLPVTDAVRVEELLNYFDYDYPVPGKSSQPFRMTTEFGPNPWNPQTKLLHIGIQGYEVARTDIPAANLVFLIDVSGSMQSPDKLGLVKKGLDLLARRMRAQDRVSIVVYAGASGVVLEPTPGDATFRITRALERLSAGGSTNGAAGIRLAYRLAESAFIKGGVNRILLATDGDFNVGTTSFERLMDLVAEKRRTGIGLSTLGFGTGNYNDRLAEQLADRGNGSYAYIDTLNEANKVLVDQLSATLMTIAKDVKVQIEFNPAVVAEYRLVGYENRVLKREDFNNDRVDAGEIGAGHSVTALYEITLAGSGAGRIDPLRYGKVPAATAHRDEVATLKLRYKKPAEDSSRLVRSTIHVADMVDRLADTSERYRFAAAVAGFGQLLRGGRYLQHFAYQDVLELARTSRGRDPDGYRGEFIQLVKLARNLDQASLGHADPHRHDRGID